MWNSLPNGSLSFLWVEGDGSIQSYTDGWDHSVLKKGPDVHGVLGRLHKLQEPICACEWQPIAYVKLSVTHASKDNRCVRVKKR